MKRKTRIYFFSIFLALLLTCVLVANSFARLKVVSAASSYCAVTYLLGTTPWPGNFEARVPIQNTSSSAWTSWELVFSFRAPGQVMHTTWNGSYTQSGMTVTIKNVSYNGNVAAKDFVKEPGLGFQFGRTNSSPVPTSFTVNGHLCSLTVGTFGSMSVITYKNDNPVKLLSLQISSSLATNTNHSSVALPSSYISSSSAASYNPKTMAGTHIGNATVFSGIGGAYGGCGVPLADLDSKDYVALNVQDDPRDYSTRLSRPIAVEYAKDIGMFDNGHNCGRWVQVTIGDNCLGTNDGAPNKPFCHGGSWTADRYNGATLNMVVADSCQEGNAWCRDDPFHLDLVQSSLNQFVLHGQPVSNMYPSAWSNRHVSWQFTSAPNYTGDIKIAFLRGASPAWSAISITHLANGIHGVQYYHNGTWVMASMDSDMGNDYVIMPTMTGGNRYQIQVYDSSDKLINYGRIYSFSYPTSCGSSCSADYLPIPYSSSPMS